MLKLAPTHTNELTSSSIAQSAAGQVGASHGDRRRRRPLVGRSSERGGFCPHSGGQLKHRRKQQQRTRPRGASPRRTCDAPGGKLRSPVGAVHRQRERQQQQDAEDEVAVLQGQQGHTRGRAEGEVWVARPGRAEALSTTGQATDARLAWHPSRSLGPLQAHPPQTCLQLHAREAHSAKGLQADKVDDSRNAAAQGQAQAQPAAPVAEPARRRLLRGAGERHEERGVNEASANSREAPASAPTNSQLASWKGGKACTERASKQGNRRTLPMAGPITMPAPASMTVALGQMTQGRR